MTTRRLITWLGALVAASAFVGTLAACQQTDCGTGTIDQNGHCVPADDAVGNAPCGAGTELKNGKCVPTQTVVCDPTSTMAQIDNSTDPPTVTCIGTGTHDCSTPISCPASTGGKMSLCGQLVDIETNDPIRAGGTPMGMNCDPNAPDPDGPCSLRIRVYDALAFAGNPNTATELAHDAVVIDDCGRYRVTGINYGAAQFIGIGVDNNTMVTTKLYDLSGNATLPQPGTPVTGFPLYATRIATDTTWSTAAGLSPSLVTRGVYTAIFLYHNAPVAGVKITKSGTAPTLFYFKDTDPTKRSMIDTSLTVTGVDGAGLATNSTGLTNYSGTGSEPTGCMWPSNFGDQIAGVNFIQPRIAVKPDNTTVCP